MKTARLVRLEKSDQGLVSTLVIDGRVICFALELDTTFIKPGCYECNRYHSEKYPDTFEIMVPGHSKVLFHIGNTEQHTKGCVLLGQEVGYIDGKRAVTESGNAFTDFMKVMGNDQCFKLFVENHL